MNKFYYLGSQLVSHSGEGVHPIQGVFLKKTHQRGTPRLKNIPPPSIETWSTVHEMIPRKSTINNNLKSSLIPLKMCEEGHF